MRRLLFVRTFSYLSLLGVLLVVCLWRPAHADLTRPVTYDEIRTPTEVLNTPVGDDRIAGRYSLSWNRLDRAGRPVARGLYLLRLKSNAGNDARKLVLQQR